MPLAEAESHRSGASGGDADRERFASLYAGSARALWCIAAGVLRNGDGAHDVVQDAAIIAMRKFAQFDPATSFTAWAGQIVRYVALNERRRLRRERAMSSDHLAAPARDSGGGSDRGFDGRVLAALDVLADTPRACLLMRTVMQMSFREIASALDIPEGTAMSHIFRSRRTLRSLLSGGGDEEGGRP